MLDIYLEPNRAFNRLKERPVWLVPLVIVVVANMAFAFLAAQHVNWDEQREQAIERMRERNMSEEQIQQALEGMERFRANALMRYGLPLAGALITSLIGIFFITTIYHLSLPLLGTSPVFLRTLAVVTNAGLVAVPSTLVRALLVIIRRSADVHTSLLLAFPNMKKGFLAILLDRIDLFAIWQLLLAGLGLKVMYDIKGNKSFWLVFTVWGILTLIFALLGGQVR
ncbi:MAG: YIP1 family protein [candidate division WOR-3 bacterium]